MPRRPRRVGDPKRAIGYVRVSTDEQHLGPIAQRDALERWCAAQGATLVSVHEDLGVSGGAPLDERPALIAALAELEQLGAGLLLVAKRDRLARDAFAAGVIHREVEARGAAIVSADGMGNGVDPADVLMRQMLDAFAQYERGVIRARTRAALMVKRRRQEFLGGRTAPYGCRVAGDGVHLEPEAGEQEVIVAAKRLHAQGLSLRAVASQLAERGALARNGQPFVAAQVQRMLRSLTSQ